MPKQNTQSPGLVIKEIKEQQLEQTALKKQVFQDVPHENKCVGSLIIQQMLNLKRNLHKTIEDNIIIPK